MSSPRPLEISATCYLIEYTWADLFSSVQIHSVSQCATQFFVFVTPAHFFPLAALYPLLTIFLFYLVGRGLALLNIFL